MEFFETPAFTRNVHSYLGEEGLRDLQNRLALAPGLGDVIPGTGGFRKLRWAEQRGGKGRRGGLRTIYYFFSSEQQIWLFALYNKNERQDLSPSEKKGLKRAIEAEIRVRRISLRTKRSKERDSQI
jgi:hypothetical protein